MCSVKILIEIWDVGGWLKYVLLEGVFSFDWESEGKNKGVI